MFRLVMPRRASDQFFAALDVLEALRLTSLGRNGPRAARLAGAADIKSLQSPTPGEVLANSRPVERSRERQK